MPWTVGHSDHMGNPALTSGFLPPPPPARTAWALPEPGDHPLPPVPKPEPGEASAQAQTTRGSGCSRSKGKETHRPGEGGAQDRVLSTARPATRSGETPRGRAGPAGLAPGWVLVPPPAGGRSRPDARLASPEGRSSASRAGVPVTPSASRPPAWGPLTEAAVGVVARGVHRRQHQGPRHILVSPAGTVRVKRGGPGRQPATEEGRALGEPSAPMPAPRPT